eukprot:gnl/MRDRNA2_/MRDRNA2_27304_c0_seq1.p1 gnl/MRDRNA2_/MRDRNA2_27304_c0~~gnl/MRDRNA2_/MRDRNA2_27304_c0_seq1.p1  ORF type:complete len:394 (-),score=59.86 gnl/MRDRNA2_/MRDRNA2_27304_c0_seq1:9-1118(-)
MGAALATESDMRIAPPPPHPSQATVFVLRNGGYEPQYLMPIAPREDTFSPEGLPRNPAFLRPAPPDLKQTRLMKNPANLKKKSLRIEGDSLVSQELTFQFDTLEPVSVIIKFLMYEEVHSDDDGNGAPITLLPQDNSANFQNPIETQSFPKGMNQTYRSTPFDITKWPQSRLKFCKDRPQDIPIVIELKVNERVRKTTNPNGGMKIRKSCSQFTYVCVDHAMQARASLKPISVKAPLVADVLAQHMQYGDRRFTLKEVFGKEKLADNECEGNTECVICMSEPRDTAVLPCRHLCFCNYCAGIVRIQCDRCPICRQKVSSLLQFRKEEMEEDKSPVARAAAAAEAQRRLAANPPPPSTPILEGNEPEQDL